jgi:GcrA cell cycle regulator
VPFARHESFPPAGQPLPPQPSANEISPEAFTKVNEVSQEDQLDGIIKKVWEVAVGDPATEQFWFCGFGRAAGQITLLRNPCQRRISGIMSSRRDRR